MKDVGFDLTPYEKSKQLKIVDSEEWFFSTTRQQKFKDLSELEVQLNSKATEALQTGFNYLAVISETDMLVRKGFLPSYLEFEGLVNSQLGRAKIAVVCAFDKRELLAAGVRDVSADISRLHSEVL
ncbi:MAG: MEDS domain-containing protein [Nitrososphaerales archaeon]